MQVSRWKSFSTGYLAGTVILAVTLTTRFFFDSPFLPEIIAGNIFAIAPGELESLAVSTLGVYAKYLTAIGAAFGLAMVYGLSGILYVWFDERFEIGGKISKGFLFSLLPWLVHTVLVILLATSFPRPDIVNTSMYLFLAHLFYGATLIAFYPKPTIIEEEQEIEKRGVKARRIFIRRVGPAAIAIAILIYGIDRFLLPFSGTPQIKEETIPELYSKEITPVGEFYRTDISLIPPRIDLAEWTLTIDGEVENDKTFTDDQIKALTSVDEYATLTCISNSVGGPLIGNALWEGVHLSTLLEQAKVKPEAQYVVFLQLGWI